MSDSMIEKTKRDCIRCNNCRRHCDFLTKYEINLKEFCERPDLAKSCFLCDKCFEVCPKKLSGRAIAQELRQANPGKHRGLKFLKQNYKLRNNSSRPSQTLLFLGCNYPGFYPKTCSALIDLCRARGIDFSVDCCKKPLVEQGEVGDFSPIKKLLEQKGTKRLICACPNCYHLLKQVLDVEVISLYAFFKEAGVGEKLTGNLPIFFPCSDRLNREIFEDIKYFIEDWSEPYAEVNCCGLGGGAALHEPDLLEAKKKRLKELDQGCIYTYCASCSGIFGKYGLNNIKNLASEILGVQEEVSLDYGINVLKYKVRRRHGR